MSQEIEKEDNLGSVPTDITPGEQRIIDAAVDEWGKDETTVIFDDKKPPGQRIVQVVRGKRRAQVTLNVENFVELAKSIATLPDNSPEDWAEHPRELLGAAVTAAAETLALAGFVKRVAKPSEEPSSLILP